MDAENTHQVFHWLWSSGQLSERDIEALPSLGIELVINLALPTSSNALPMEAELVTGLGLAYVHLPVLWERPALDKLEQFFCILSAFEGRNTWVHCAMNKRVSTFVYLYRRLCRNESEQAASNPMRKVWEPNDVWIRFIRHALEVSSQDPMCHSFNGL